MSVHFIVEPGIYGARVTLAGEWNPAIADYMRDQGVRELYLNNARGWSGSSLDFLESVPNLLAFSILDFKIANVAGIHRLSELRSLEVSTYCHTQIDFGRFSGLESCVFYWRYGSDSLFDCANLRQLFIHRYSEASSERFARLGMLESLAIANGEIREVESIGDLSNLTTLGLYNLKALQSLRGVDKLTRLQTLEVNGCKGIQRIDELAALPNMRRLQLNDDGAIASLRPLRSATKLEEALFYESTRIVDGDLTPLTMLPKLTRVSFQNRRHYSHSRQDFELPRSPSRTMEVNDG